MFEKLNTDLKSLDVSISANDINNSFSDYLMCYKDSIIGFGWKSNNNLSKGFMGLWMPNFEGEDIEFSNEISTKILSNLNDDLNFEKSMYLFQFAISENKYWFSPPIADLMKGIACPSLNDTNIIIEYLRNYIKNQIISKDENSDDKIYLAIEKFKKEITL